MFDDLATFYQVFGTLVTREDGAFRGILDVATVDAFGGPQLVGDHVLRYPTAWAPDLAPGERVTAAGTAYRVAGDPLPINAQESVAQLGAVA